MLADKTKYTFITGVIASLKNKLLNEKIISAICTSKDLSEIVSLLQQTIYSKYISLTEKNNIDLKNFKKNTYDWLLSFIINNSHDHQLLNLFQIDFDVHNLKLLIKEKILETTGNSSFLEYGAIVLEELKQIILNENYDRLPLELQKIIFQAIENYYKEKKLQEIDYAFDNYLLAKKVQLATQLKSNEIINYYKVFIDLKNIQIILRSKNLLILDSLFKSNILIKEGNIDFYDFEKENILNIENLIKIIENYEYLLLANALKKNPKDLFKIETLSSQILYENILKCNNYICGVEPLWGFAKHIERDLQMLNKLFIMKKNNMNIEVKDFLLKEI